MNKADVTVVILTKNEEANIERCINSVKGWCERIVVVDSGSTDNTVKIALELGAEIFHHKPFVDYAKQFNWAIDNTDIKTTWVFRLDADECVTLELKNEIINECEKHKDDNVSGMMMRFKIFFLGKFLKHGGAYPFLKITIFKFGKGRFEDRSMGEHIVLSEGKCIDLKEDCEHYDFKNLNAFIDKHNWYATREVADYFAVRDGRVNAVLDGQPEKAKKLRDGLYYRLPRYTRAKLYYWYKFYFKMGFLDGEAGRIWAFLQAYFYRFVVDAKIYEKELTGGGKILIFNMLPNYELKMAA